MVVPMDLVTFTSHFTIKINKNLPDGTIMHVSLVVQATWQYDIQINGPVMNVLK